MELGSSLMAPSEQAPDLLHCSTDNVSQQANISNLPTRPSVDIKFSNLSYTVRSFRNIECKTLLKNLSGHFHTGEMTAVMGPSGAGKSTLLNVIAGYKTKFKTGDIMVNGSPRDLKRFRKQSCYIMQDSELLPQLTVLETMEIASCLKLGVSVSKEERQQIVQGILTSLGLQECSNTLASKLSGGQRKRLCIGQELVSNPPAMFLDEPTSGLDSASCYQCISLLKKLAQEGRMIVCSIHQPSARIMEMFDQLYFLADGQCIYKGAIQGLVPFLSKSGFRCPTYHNPADYAMEVACGEHGDAVPQLVRAVSLEKHCIYIPSKQSNTKNIYDNAGTSNIGECSKKEEKMLFSNSSWTQFHLLMKRSLLCTSRDMTQTHLRIAANVVVGIVIGCLFYKNGNDASKIIFNNAFLMVCALFLMFCSMMPTIVTFPLENAVFMREHLNSWYSLKSYYLAKSLADVPLQILCTVVFLTLAYFLTHQPIDPFRMSMFLLIGLLTSLNAQSVGLLVGAIVDLKNGVVLGPTITLPLTMFSGFFVPFHYIPEYLRWLTYISYLRYSWEGLVIITYGYERDNLDCDEFYCHFRSPKKFMKEIGVEQTNVWFCIAALTILLLIKRILTFIILKYRLSRQ